MVIKKYTYNFEAVKKAALIFGSMYKLAKALDVSYQTVFRWCHNKNVPDSLNCIRIEQATNGDVKRQEILPDFPWDELK